MITAIRPYAVITNTTVGVLRDPLIIFDDHQIRYCGPFQQEKLDELPVFDWIHRPDAVLIPGFVQPHIHLCQTMFRGLADDLKLLPWLQTRIMPFEAAHTPESMALSAEMGIRELLSGGTTTLMDMGSVHHYESVLQMAADYGIRGYFGKALMDKNDLFPPLSESTEQALQSSGDQSARWHGFNGGLIRYAMTPRYILSCSDDLLVQSFRMAENMQHGFYHTHAAEQRDESAAVKAVFGHDAIEHFEKLGVLSGKTGLAHGIWLSDDDYLRLADSGSRVFHCPSSNVKLGSGVANLVRLQKEGILTGLAADGAPCNNRLDMFREMNLAAGLQSVTHGPGEFTARQVFEMATIGGAKGLNWDDRIGSIEPGKAADLALVSLLHSGRETPPLPDDSLYSYLVYEASADLVTEVWVNGSIKKFRGELVKQKPERFRERVEMEMRRIGGRDW